MLSASECPLGQPTIAAVLLMALPFLRELGLARPKAVAVLNATGVTKSQAYALRGSLCRLAYSLERPVGRPPKERASSDAQETQARLTQISKEVLRFLLAHPGAARRGEHRLHASPGFKHLVVSLCAGHPDIDTEAIAQALDLPGPTLREWRRKAEEGVSQASPEEAPPKASAVNTATQLAVSDSRDLAVQTILEQYQGWTGSFSAFCEHIHHNHKLAFGRTAIASVLEQACVRLPGKRPGRTPDEKALRDSFCNFFPGAQWTGDGASLAVVVEDERFVFNLELLVDTCTGTFVGLDVRDNEDAAALVCAFEEGVRATGKPPLAVLIDNKPCNSAPEVEEALGETILIPATIARPENKGHVEGGFGLLAQHAPPLILEGSSKKERARCLVELVCRTFYGLLNMRPRKNRKNMSRIELYEAAEPTPEEVERAKASLQARLEKQRKARETLRKRQDPKKRVVLHEAFSFLDFGDPKGHILDSIAYFPFLYILAGIAIFKAKKAKGTLPEGVDARYLLGIVKKHTQKEEGMAIAMALWDERIRAREICLEYLRATQKKLTEEHPELETRLVAFVDEAFALTETTIDRHFWLEEICDLICAEPIPQRKALYELTLRRVHGSFEAPYEDRLSATHHIAGRVVPV